VLPAAIAGVGLHVDTTAYVFWSGGYWHMYRRAKMTETPSGAGYCSSLSDEIRFLFFSERVQ